MKKILFTILAVLIISLSAFNTLAIGSAIDNADSDSSSDSSSDSDSDSGFSLGGLLDNIINFFFPQEGDTLVTDQNPIDSVGNPGDSTNWDTDSDQTEDEVPDEKNDPLQEGTEDREAPLIAIIITPNNPALNQKVKIKAIANDESGISTLEIKIDARTFKIIRFGFLYFFKHSVDCC